MPASAANSCVRMSPLIWWLMLVPVASYTSWPFRASFVSSAYSQFFGMMVPQPLRGWTLALAAGGMLHSRGNHSMMLVSVFCARL